MACTTTGDVHVGDVGTLYKAKIRDAGLPFDPTSADVIKIIFKPPGEDWVERDAAVTTDGTDWFINYVVTSGPDDAFHYKKGLWRWQGLIRFPDGQRYSTNIETFTVYPNIDGSEPWIPVVTTIEQYAASIASPGQGMGACIWYSRPLRRDMTASITIVAQSPDPSRYPNVTMLYYPALSNLNINGDARGEAKLVFINAPLDLTGADAMSFVINDSSARTGWNQFFDLSTGEQIPNSLGDASGTIYVEANIIVGPAASSPWLQL